MTSLRQQTKVYHVSSSFDFLWRCLKVHPMLFFPQGETDPNAARRAWSSLHCHMDAELDFADQKRAQRQLLFACVLTLFFMVSSSYASTQLRPPFFFFCEFTWRNHVVPCRQFGEAIGGYLSNSLAVMTDAAHLLSDFAAFLISLFSIWLGRQKPSKRMSFGYYRAGLSLSWFSTTVSCQQIKYRS